MELNFDSHTITLTCPGCHKEFDETVGRLKNNPTLTCPGCGSPIDINADELRRGIETVMRSLGNFGK